MVIKNLFAVVLLGFVFNVDVKASDLSSFWPGITFTEQVPKITQVLGYEHGEKISSPDQLVTYFKALSKANPSRTRLVEYARSWEDRPLYYLVITSKQNMARLDEIKTNMQRLANPVGLDASAQKSLIDNTPAVSWLSYGVHGDEVSSSDAALLAAYFLLAAKDSPEVDAVLNNTVVILDPSQNPDGRSRFVEHYRQTAGRSPAAHPLAAEHLQRWPGGRTNHYLFDMNRDWFALTQPESRGRVAHYLAFQPVVHVDIHEMGTDESYYFPPPVEPFNPHITDDQRENLIMYGKGNAAAFDQFQFDYFTREIFDAYYPGYGDTWPAFHGAVGMTFEMASARGLVQLRSDGGKVTYRDGVHRHFVSSFATMLTTANNHKTLLNEFVSFRLSAMADKQQYLLTGGDRSLQDKLAKLLVSQGVAVQQTSRQTRVCGENYAAGTIVIRAGQPAGRLVRTLMDANSPIDEAFWQEKERIRAQGLNVNLYDILAWSLPALYNLDVANCKSPIKNLVSYQSPNDDTVLREAKLAYLIPWGTVSAVRFLAAAFEQQLIVRGSDKAFELAGRNYEPGTLIIKVKDNNDGLHQRLQSLMNQFAVQVIATDSSWTDSGVNFGSDNVKILVAPTIALAWDNPTDANAAGNLRYVIEQELGYATTPIRTQHLSDPDLADFDVLILPDGYGYASVLKSSGIENIKSWVDNGGTLITLGRATRLLMSDGLGLLSTHLEARGEVKEDDAVEGLAAASFIDSIDDYEELIHTIVDKPDYIPGVMLQGETNKDHWLSGGVAKTLNFMVTGSDVYTPLKQDAGVNLVKFKEQDSLLLGGYMWQENRKQLAHKPAVMVNEVGRGLVVGFVSNATFRGYMDGLNVLLANAIFKGPAHTKGR